MRLACIDIGTNTTRLLVAEPHGAGLRPIQGWRAFTRPANGWVPGGELPPEVIAFLAGEVARQLSIARAAGAERVRAVGTAIVRDAANRQELVEAIRASCGLDVEVLTHEREARLAFLGASRTLSEPVSGAVGVVDVGGGSSELAVGSADGVAHWWASVPLGSATVTERWLDSDPPTAGELQAAGDAVGEAFDSLEPPPVELAIAVGGSAVTLGAMAGGELGRRSLQRLLATLVASPSPQTAQSLSLDLRRARVLPAAVIVLQRALEVLGCPLRVGSGGVREGVILEELARG